MNRRSALLSLVATALLPIASKMKPPERVRVIPRETQDFAAIEPGDLSDLVEVIDGHDHISSRLIVHEDTWVGGVHSSQTWRGPLVPGAIYPLGEGDVIKPLMSSCDPAWGFPEPHPITARAMDAQMAELHYLSLNNPLMGPWLADYKRIRQRAFEADLATKPTLSDIVDVLRGGGFIR